MKKHGFLLGLLLNALGLFAQDFNDYQPLKNQGQLPADFTVLPSVKYAKDLKKIDANGKRSTRSKQKSFYLSSNFAIDGLLKSGKVLFETEHAAYLKEIIALLLKDKPELSKKIRVYLLRTPSVNAFATADGIVFVTMGLLAQVENEAQLAYILSHEVVHVDKKHALELVMQSDQSSNANNRQKLSRNGEITDKNLAKNLFTQDQELEADREGYGLFAKTNYSTENINRVFDVLKYSELPFENLPFERNFFETDYLKFPNAYFLEKVKGIEGINEKKDDSQSSHPNLFKRRSEISALVANKTDANKKEYIISKDRFEKLQKISRFEIPQLQLHQQLFHDAIYTAFLLKKVSKTAQYPEIITAKALYGLAKYKNNSRIDAAAELINKDSIEGESQQLYHLFDKMSNKELTIFATSYVWRTSKKYKTKTDLAGMARDLLWLLVSKHDLASGDFSAVEPTNAPLSTKSKEEAKDSSKMTKIDRIKQEGATAQTSVSNKDWWQYAFVECLKEKEFTELFDKMTAEKKKNNESDFEDEQERKLSEAKAKGYFLGIPKIVVVNPNYIKLTRTQKIFSDRVDINLIDSEKNIARFSQLMKENADEAGIGLTMLNSFEFSKTDAQKLNDFTLLKEWYNEQSDAGSMTVSGFRQKEIEELAKKYNTDYFLWTGVIGLHYKTPPVMKVFGAMFIPTVIMAPIGIWLMKDTYDMYYYSILYNVKTGKNYIIKSEEFSKKDTDMLLNAHIYDTFSQIKTKKDGAKEEAKEEKSAPEKVVKKKKS